MRTFGRKEMVPNKNIKLEDMMGLGSKKQRNNDPIWCILVFFS